MNTPPFRITEKVLNLATQIQEIIGELKGHPMAKPSVKLRKENRIKTIHHSLAIEGNSLSEDQITALVENKKVLGPKNQIIEVLNALTLYDRLEQFNPLNEKDLLKAHKLLLKDLVTNAGKYRPGAVGVFKGTKISHVAPPAKQIPILMRDLFHFIEKNKSTSWIIKACVFHYELEFIHPFEDGNGRMGRLWQQLLLMKHSPIFEFISVETLIHKKQNQYYKVLEQCDRSGDSTSFVEFSLELIWQSLQEFHKAFHPGKPKISDRIEHALEYFGTNEFSRKDYLKLYKDISTATASRDLSKAVLEGSLKITGEKAQAVYRKTTKKPSRS